MILPVTATKATKSVHPRLGTGRGIGRCHERSLAGPYPSLGFLPRLGPSRRVRAALFAARRSDASRLASDAQNRRCTHVAEKESQARAAIRFQSRAGGVGARSGADTGAQASYLKTLSEQANEAEAYDETLTKAEASRRIDALKAKLAKERRAGVERPG